MTAKRPDNTSAEIARFVSRARANKIPAEVFARARLHVLDGLATMLGGIEDAASRTVHRHIAAAAGKKECSIIGTRMKTTAQQAALAHGVQGHVLDFDDAQLATYSSRPPGQQAHPTSPVLGACLALSEKLRAHGAAFLTAYIVGVEVACRLADAVDPRHYLDGFHPTGTLGTFGAAAAAAHLLKLHPRRITAALAIAGTFASGLRANRGTMTKALNAGRAAENGVLAASLAAMGFTGSANIFDDPMGFFSAACRDEVDRELLRFGKPYFFLKPGIAIKLYPCAGVLHPALDVILELVRGHDIDPRDVEHVRVRLNETAAQVLVYPRPRDGLQTKFSMPFAAAVAVMDREAGLQQFTSRRLHDAELHRLMARVKLVQTSGAAATEVEIALRSGQCYSGRAAIARGHPKLPASRAEIENKFRSCASAVLPRARIEKFLEQFRSWEKPHCSSRWLQTLRAARA